MTNFIVTARRGYSSRSIGLPPGDAWFRVSSDSDSIFQFSNVFYWFLLATFGRVSIRIVHFGSQFSWLSMPAFSFLGRPSVSLLAALHVDGSDFCRISPFAFSNSPFEQSISPVCAEISPVQLYAGFWLVGCLHCRGAVRGLTIMKSTWESKSQKWYSRVNAAIELIVATSLQVVVRKWVWEWESLTPVGVTTNPLDTKSK